MNNFKMYLAAFLFSVLAQLTFAQTPPESPDCWRCTEKYCWEEAAGFQCPNLPCEWVWKPHPTDPNLQIRGYYCSPPDNPFAEAVTEVVNGKLSYKHCVQQGAGHVLRGHSETDVVCSVLYKCGCDQNNKCVQGEKIRDQVVRKNSSFRDLQPGNVCIYVEATPGSGTPAVNN